MELRGVRILGLTFTVSATFLGEYLIVATFVLDGLFVALLTGFEGRGPSRGPSLMLPLHFGLNSIQAFKEFVDPRPKALACLSSMRGGAPQCWIASYIVCQAKEVGQDSEDLCG